MEQITQVFSSFGVTWPAFLASVVNFAILLFVLHRFAYKPLLQVMDERRKRIEESMKQTEQIKAELAKSQAARDEILRKANDSAQRMIDEARQAADKFRDQKLNEALQQAQEVLRKAQQAGAGERDRMMAELRKEMVGLVIATTARVTGKILTPEDQKRLQEETLKELAA
ncbi:MAG: F0F1 ATP synthase subunit B [Verrucomicrobiae bacterium]|nr:F0F1 ATP synthase subunit B [Verrucomicrobiae bacterium]